MDELRLSRIEDKLDKLVEVQTLIQLDLAEHIRRTELAEQSIEVLANEIKPIQEHVAFLRVSGKLVTALAALAAVITTLWQLLGGK